MTTRIGDLGFSKLAWQQALHFITILDLVSSEVVATLVV
jgi:hypothetical protein